MPDTIHTAPYAIGYSFRNPRVVAPVTKARPQFFMMNWGVKGPAQVKEEMYASGELQRFPTVWRRAAKDRNIHKLGAAPLNRKEIPNFNELGAAPGPTDTTQSDVSRGFFGFLNNVITSAGQAISQQQQLSVAKAQASAMGPTPFMPGGITYGGGGGGLGVLGWTAIIGAVGVGAFFMLKK